MGLVALQHVASSRIRDWTCVPWFGRWILYHWTTREVLTSVYVSKNSREIASSATVMTFFMLNIGGNSEENQNKKRKRVKRKKTATAAKSLRSCPTLCDPIDGSPPASPVPGILQARTQEWVSNSFSNAWKWKVKVKSLSLLRLFATPWTAAYQAPPSTGFSSQEYWSGLPLPSPEKERKGYKIIVY